jgi:hypothetical protein
MGAGFGWTTISANVVTLSFSLATLGSISCTKRTSTAETRAARTRCKSVSKRFVSIAGTSEGHLQSTGITKKKSYGRCSEFVFFLAKGIKNFYAISHKLTTFLDKFAILPIKAIRNFSTAPESSGRKPNIGKVWIAPRNNTQLLLTARHN